MFPIADVATELFEGPETPVIDDGQRKWAQHTHVQRAYRLALIKREKQPIRHMEFFPTALGHVRVHRYLGHVRVLTVQHRSAVLQQLSCKHTGKNKKSTTTWVEINAYNI